MVIAEILYHPPDFPGGRDNSDDEYVELQNITGGAVPLFNPAATTNTWRLRGGVDYDLPTNVTMAANGFLLVVNFDPTKPDNARQLASFRNKYGVPGNVPSSVPTAASSTTAPTM